MAGTFATPRRRTPRYERLVNGKAVASNDDQRSCAHPKCSTKLSRYNPDNTCNVHGGWTDESVPRRGRKPGAELGVVEDPDTVDGATLEGEEPVGLVTARRARSTA